MKFASGGTITSPVAVQLRAICFSCKRAIPGTEYVSGEVVICRKCIK